MTSNGERDPLELELLAMAPAEPEAETRRAIGRRLTWDTFRQGRRRNFYG